MRFADFDDSAAKQGYCPGVVGAAWVCEQHLSVALEFTHMPVESAVSHLRQSIGVESFAFSEGLNEPHLFVDDTGPNRAKVFAILRAATAMTPQQTKSLSGNPIWNWKLLLKGDEPSRDMKLPHFVSHTEGSSWIDAPVLMLIE